MKKRESATALLKKAAQALIEALARLDVHYVLCPGTMKLGFVVLDTKYDPLGLRSGKHIKLKLKGDDLVDVEHLCTGWTVRNDPNGISMAAWLIAGDHLSAAEASISRASAYHRAVKPPGIDDIRFEARSSQPPRGTSRGG